MRHLTTLLLALAALAGALRAEPLLVTRAQIDEYLLATGRAPTDAEKPEVFASARQGILEHTLLARAFEVAGRRLDESQLAGLREEHLDTAIRVLRERRLVVAPVSDRQVEEHALLARAVQVASHILLADEARADSVRALIEAGEDFGRLARALSQDPGSAEQGGVLGEVRAGDTVIEFEEALLHLQPGEVSGPVESPFGWHLIRLDSRRELEGDWDVGELADFRRRLEERARRQAENELDLRLLARRGVELRERTLLARGAPGDTVLAGRDTVLVRRQLESAIETVFGDRASLLGPDLTVEYLRFWARRDAWRREAEEARAFDDDEVLDRIDLRERLLKSGLFVSEVLAPSLTWTDTDLFNYLVNHEEEFLGQRAFGVWKFEFRTKEEAAEAGRTILREGLTPQQAAERYGTGDDHPFELDAAEARALPNRQGSKLIELDAGTWSDPVENGLDGARRRWVLWHLIGRRMPDLDEGPELRAAVAERVRAAMLDSAIAREVLEMQDATGWTETVVVR